MDRKSLAIYLFTFSMLFLYSASLKSQGVTIGSKINPKSGSLLDLKQSDADGENSNRGILLPRVDLTNKKDLYPMFKDDATYTGAEKTTQDALHTGLIVFNSNQCFMGMGQDRGLYVWDGVQWALLGDSEGRDIVSPLVTIHKDQDGNDFRARQFGDPAAADYAGEWMLENLRAKNYAPNILNGAPIESTLIGAAYVYPRNDATTTGTVKELGLLYNFNATIATATAGIVQGLPGTTIDGIGRQGVCPEGWHVPTAGEWILLEKELQKNPALYSSETASLGAWNPAWETTIGSFAGNHAHVFMNPCVAYDANLAVNNSVGQSFTPNMGGFSAQLAGSYNTTAGYDTQYGSHGFFWTNSVESFTGTIQPRYQEFEMTSKSLKRGQDKDVAHFMAVRCKKDEWKPFDQCGDPLTDDENNQYNTTTFGANCWTTQNLRVVDGLTNTDYVLADAANPEEILYTWKAANKDVLSEVIMYNDPIMGSEPSMRVQGICPDGWFLPTDKDWSDMEEYILTTPAEHTTSGTAGTWTIDYNSAKDWRPETGTAWGGYLLAAQSLQPGTSFGGTSKPSDQKGFSALLTGSVIEGETTNPVYTKTANIWTSTTSFRTEASEEAAIYRGISVDGADKVYRGSASKVAKLSVRCIQPIP